MFLLIDNYDSFTYNLVQTFQQLGHNPRVLRNSEPELLQLAGSRDLEAVVISPGPGRPEHAGLCPRFLDLLPHHVPLLGVCLGHQLLAVHGGHRVVRAARIMHGKISTIDHDDSLLFAGIPQSFPAVRYHSLIMEPVPASRHRTLAVTAWTEAGEPMGLRYLDRPWMGIQFHPESVMTSDGPQLLTNFVNSWAAVPVDAPPQPSVAVGTDPGMSRMQI